jgi:hypothetical protein
MGFFWFKTKIFPSQFVYFTGITSSRARGLFFRSRAEKRKSATRQPTLFVRVARRLSSHVDQLKQVCLVLDITGENQKHLSRRKKLVALPSSGREKANFLPDNRKLWILNDLFYSGMIYSGSGYYPHPRNRCWSAEAGLSRTGTGTGWNWRKPETFK